MKALLLSSSPVHRKTVTRVEGLRDYGAEIVVAGYKRDNFEDTAAVNYEVVPLGFARNRDVVRRVLSFPALYSRALGAARRLDRCDVIWANSLDMLLLAIALRPLLKGDRRIIYDVQDLSPWQLSRGLAARAVRAGEWLACRSIDALILTSPWFYWRYYRNLLRPTTRVHLLENKVSPPAPLVAPSPGGPPWRIVWNGLIRCRQSLAIMAELARTLPEAVDIHIWGHISEDLAEAFHAVAASRPNVRLRGTYSDTAIDEVFEGAHFVFAFDLDDGENSRLLLPNRLYHGVARALPLIGVAESAIGKTIASLGLGMPVATPHADTLIEFFRTLTPESYETLRRRIPEDVRTRAVYSNDLTRIMDDITRGSGAQCVPREESDGVVLAI